MNVVTYAAFKDELTKIAWHSGAEIAGLGMLAAPTIQKMRGKPMSQRSTNAAEVGGLGVLAVPAAHSIYKAVKKGGMAAIKHASIDKEALFGLSLGAAAKAVPKAAFKPSFAGHAKSLGVGTRVAKTGVETTKSFNPLSQTLSKSKSLSIPGLT